MTIRGHCVDSHFSIVKRELQARADALPFNAWLALAIGR